MTEVRRADPAVRRQAVSLVVFGTVVGALLILGLEHYRTPLRDWLLAEPGERARRVKLALSLPATLLSAPLVAFAAYLWSLGARVVRAGEFPPPGYRVIRDTSVIVGPAAVLRGRGLKAFAVCLGVASALLWLLLWWLGSVLSEHAT
jgi:hypothetical protein